jgi:hypothetical protein
MCDEYPDDRNIDEPCEVCGTKEDVEYIPDPFDEEVWGDTNMRWLCDNCANEIAQDI